MRVLVTGGRGFVGRELVSALRVQGHQVRELSLSLGGDVTNFEQVKAAVKGIDAVYHLAAIVDEYSDELHKVNVDGTKNVLEASAKSGVKQFIFLSTVGVMGNIEEKADEITGVSPVTEYEQSKAEAEKLVASYREILPVTIMRAALVYGDNKYWHQIVTLMKNNFPLIGDGNHRWQMIYIKDLVSALLFVLDKRGTLGQTFIVAERNGKTLREVYSIIRKETHVPGRIKTFPVVLARFIAFLMLISSEITGKESIFTPAHVERLIRLRHYDTSKINRLGWKNKYSTEQGLKEMVLEMRETELI